MIFSFASEKTSFLRNHQKNFWKSQNTWTSASKYYSDSQEIFETQTENIL